MKKVFLVLVALALLADIASAARRDPLPAAFVHDRVFVSADAPDGTRIEFYTDTGGGFNAIEETLAGRLGMRPSATVAVDDGEVTVTEFPEWMRQAGVPAPLEDALFGGRLVLAPRSRIGRDGFLGSRWFAGRVWEFDYAAGSLAVLHEWTARVDDGQRVELGFRHGTDGQRNLNFPRITLTIDDEPIELLLDTGATAKLAAHAAAELGLPAGSEVGTSYVIASTFARWVERHPDWKVIPAAETVTGHAFPMIEVPAVTIAGLEFGPVWFSQRPDSVFRGWMSQMMDRSIDGALGGSAFKHLRVVIDYPGSAAYLRPATARQDQAGPD